MSNQQGTDKHGNAQNPPANDNFPCLLLCPQGLVMVNKANEHKKRIANYIGSQCLISFSLNCNGGPAIPAPPIESFTSTVMSASENLLSHCV